MSGSEGHETGLKRGNKGVSDNLLGECAEANRTQVGHNPRGSVSQAIAQFEGRG